MNGRPLLATPPTVTTMMPLVAPDGTKTLMLVSLHADAVAATPLNRTVLAPGVAPKLVPVSVTTVPRCPESGVRDVSVGVGSTVNGSPLLVTPATVTTMLPLVAPAGTGTVRAGSLHAVGEAIVPLNATVLASCVTPKFVPLIETTAPTGPDPGVRKVRPGVGSTVKDQPLLDTPPTVTMMLPLVAPAGTGTVILVALHAVGVAVVPLNLTVLVPWVTPKLVPVSVTTVPAGPIPGVRLVIVGVWLPVLPAARNATSCMTQDPVEDRGAVAL